MTDFNFEQHIITIKNALNGNLSISFGASVGEAFNEVRRKVYIISSECEILYVGETKTSIKIRLYRGCTYHNYYSKNIKARNGYKGYKWLNADDNPHRVLTVSVAIFNQQYDCDEQKATIESIESEIVYLIRNRLGYWPKFQNEIHFSNRKDSLKQSETIFDKVIAKMKITYPT